MYGYQIDAQTGEHQGTITLRPDPMHPGQYLIPAHTVTVPPPEKPWPDGQCATWNGSAWVMVEDHRGTPYWRTSDACPVRIDAPGAVPAGLTDQAPPPFPVWSGTGWTSDLSALAASLTSRVRAEAERLMAAATSGYPAQEQASWPILLAECRQFQADGTVGPSMTAEIGADLTAADLASMVQARSAALLSLLGGIKQCRRAHEAAIAAALAAQDAVALTGYAIDAGWPEA